MKSTITSLFRELNAGFVAPAGYSSVESAYNSPSLAPAYADFNLVDQNPDPASWWWPWAENETEKEPPLEKIPEPQPGAGAVDTFNLSSFLIVVGAAVGVFFLVKRF